MDFTTSATRAVERLQGRFPGLDRDSPAGQVVWWVALQVELSGPGRGGARSPAQTVVERGRLMPHRPRPADVSQGAARDCYRNALLLAQRRDDLVYCEGWAAGMIPVEHAWCVDGDGAVVDPTWDDDTGHVYFGVGLDVDVVTPYLIDQGFYGVFANAWQRPRRAAEVVARALIDVPAVAG